MHACMHACIMMNLTQILAFSTVVSSSIAVNDIAKLCRGDYSGKLCHSVYSAGFLVFLSVVIMIYEAAVIVARFLNFSAFNGCMCMRCAHQDISTHGLISTLLLIGEAVFTYTITPLKHTSFTVTSVSTTRLWMSQDCMSLATCLLLHIQWHWLYLHMQVDWWLYMHAHACWLHVHAFSCRSWPSSCCLSLLCWMYGWLWS